jgi:prophage maintenance system killer protein
MLVFLELDGYRVNGSDPDLASWILDLAAEMKPAELAARIRPTLTQTFPT